LIKIKVRLHWHFREKQLFPSKKQQQQQQHTWWQQTAKVWFITTKMTKHQRAASRKKHLACNSLSKFKHVYVFGTICSKMNNFKINKECCFFIFAQPNCITQNVKHLVSNLTCETKILFSQSLAQAANLVWLPAKM